MSRVNLRSSWNERVAPEEGAGGAMCTGAARGGRRRDQVPRRTLLGVAGGMLISLKPLGNPLPVSAETGLVSAAVKKVRVVVENQTKNELDVEFWSSNEQQPNAPKCEKEGATTIEPGGAKNHSATQEALGVWIEDYIVFWASDRGKFPDVFLGHGGDFKRTGCYHKPSNIPWDIDRKEFDVGQKAKRTIKKGDQTFEIVIEREHNQDGHILFRVRVR